MVVCVVCSMDEFDGWLFVNGGVYLCSGVEMLVCF